MSLKDQATLHIVLYEGDGAQALGAGERSAALTILLERGYAITRANGARPVAPADGGSLLVLGHFDGGRPPQAEDAAGRVTLRFHDIAGLDASRIAEAVESARADANAARHGEWKPWFPVID